MPQWTFTLLGSEHIIGYPLTKYTIRPFHDHDLTHNTPEATQRKKWNKKLSSVRIKIEHAFRRLKGRFPILRDFPAIDMLNTYHTIEALLILYIILEAVADDAESIEDYASGNGTRDGWEDNGRAEEMIDRPGLEYAKGLRRRKLLLNL